MIIIEGRAGKSLVLEEMINKQLSNRNVVILDSVILKWLNVPNGVEHLLLNENDSPKDVIELFEDYYHRKFEKYDWIIFSVNTPSLKNSEINFLRLDRNYRQNFIVTVQNNEIEKPIVRYI
jgi:hypothetical protein